MSFLKGPLSRFGKSKKESLTQMEQDLKDMGVSVKDDRMLINRLDTMREFISYMRNDSIDIEDKVEDMDDTIIMTGYAWGRSATNPFSAELITEWRYVMMAFRAFCLQRRFYPSSKMLVSMKVSQTGADGKATDVWVDRTFREDTAIELYNMKGPENIKLCEPIYDPGIGTDEDPAYSRDMVEFIVDSAGKAIWIETGLLVLAFFFDQMDVSTQRVFVFHQQMQMMPDAKRAVPASVYPDTSQQPGDKK